MFISYYKEGITKEDSMSFLAAIVLVFFKLILKFGKILKIWQSDFTWSVVL